MCNKKEGCLQPKEGKGDPRKCSKEQIEKCHGDVKEHCCASKPKHQL